MPAEPWRRLEDNLRFTKVRAPFPGVIVKRYRHLGDFASAGVSILSMYNPDLLYVTANLEEDTTAGRRSRQPGGAAGGRLLRAVPRPSRLDRQINRRAVRPDAPERSFRRVHQGGTAACRCSIWIDPKDKRWQLAAGQGYPSGS